MGLNLIGAATGALEGFAMGGPAGAWAGGIGGALSGGGGLAGLAGAAGNAGMAGLDAQQEAFQTAMYAEQIRHNEQMQLQSEAFDEMVDERSETMRQVNTLRDVDMEQRKADNQITKKFIQSIGE